jgi:hypothetical protein
MVESGEEGREEGVDERVFRPVRGGGERREGWLRWYGVAGATPWPNSGPWGWSGHPQGLYNKQNKNFIIILFILKIVNNNLLLFF